MRGRISEGIKSPAVSRGGRDFACIFTGDEEWPTRFNSFRPVSRVEGGGARVYIYMGVCIGDHHLRDVWNGGSPAKGAVEACIIPRGCEVQPGSHPLGMYGDHHWGSIGGTPRYDVLIVFGRLCTTWGPPSITCWPQRVPNEARWKPMATEACILRG